MKKFSIEEMATIHGGGFFDFANGFCAGAGLVGLGAYYGLLTITGVGIPIAGLITIGCTASAIYQGFS